VVARVLAAPALLGANIIQKRCDFTADSGGALTDEYNDFSYSIGSVVTNGNLCDTQGVGYYTFAMLTQAGSLGLTDSNTAGQLYAIMDNTCTLLGVYDASNLSCGIPYVLEANFLQYVLTVRAYPPTSVAKLEKLTRDITDDYCRH
jgi:hypothetical protein